MSQFKPLPPLEELKEAFAYDPDTGLFTHKTSRPSIRKGEIAGHVGNNGYCRISFKRERFLAHRWAWLFLTGNDPADLQVDHIDRVRNHNWISNLRLTTQGPNRANSISKGWTKKGSRFRAQIRIADKVTFLGSYKTSEEASAVFQQRHIEEYGDFSPYLTQ